MTKHPPSLSTVLCSLAIACGDDNTAVVEPSDASTPIGVTAAASTNGDSSTAPRLGPWGCYLADHHKCDCSVESEVACEGVGVWVEGCATCSGVEADAGSTTLDGQPPTETGAGSDASVSRDANASRDASATRDASAPPDAATRPLEAGDGITDGVFDSSVDSATPDLSTASVADAASGWGCYDPDSHQCNCGIGQPQCVADEDLWTSECACAVLDAGQ